MDKELKQAMIIIAFSLCVFISMIALTITVIKLTDSMNKYSKYDLNKDGIVNEQDLEEMQEYLCKE